MRLVTGGGQLMASRRLAHLSEPTTVGAWGEHGPRQVEDGLACLDRVGVKGPYRHAVARGQVTGGGEAALALHVDEAGSAGAERRAVRILAELRQGKAQAVHGVQHGGPRGNFDRRAVDGEAEAHTTSP